MREWVAGDRLVEAAELLVPEDIVEECVYVLEHILRPTHERYCFVPGAEDRTIVSVFGTDPTYAEVLPVCLVCPGIFTQTMSPDEAADFAEKHARSEHPMEIKLWERGHPWLSGDPRLN